MKHYEFFKKHPEVFMILANVVKSKGVKIGREYRDRDLPTIAGSSSSDGEGCYFRVRQYQCLDNKQYNILNGIFPLTIKGYELRLHGISDFEYDDDRMWEPSVSFGIYRDGINYLDGKTSRWNVTKDVYNHPKEKHWSDKF